MSWETRINPEAFKALEPTNNVEFEQLKLNVLISPESATDRFDLSHKIRKSGMKFELGSESHTSYAAKMRRFVQDLSLAVQFHPLSWYVDNIYNPHIDNLRRKGLSDKEIVLSRTYGGPVVRPVDTPTPAPTKAPKEIVAPMPKEKPSTAFDNYPTKPGYKPLPKEQKKLEDTPPPKPPSTESPIKRKIKSEISSRKTQSKKEVKNAQKEILLRARAQKKPKPKAAKKKEVSKAVKDLADSLAWLREED